MFVEKNENKLKYQLTVLQQMLHGGLTILDGISANRSCKFV